MVALYKKKKLKYVNKWSRWWNNELEKSRNVSFYKRVLTARSFTERNRFSVETTIAPKY